MAANKTILLLMLLLSVGVVWGRSALEEDRDYFQPFLTSSQKRRVCVELCLSGLGGRTCGDDCSDILPQDLPIQSRVGARTDNDTEKNVTRSDSCTFLCNNNLGDPLCACDNVNVSTKPEEVDFLQICSQFCIKYNYRISGCQKCNIYKEVYSSSESGSTIFSQQSLRMNTYAGVDWYAWCTRMCAKGDGGAACACDRLPI
ncbi:uncharacterized protein [Diabrotica undecimpunctata]|uniref:uncharacterized protein isoform X1 n=1 Tax=Diabrotica undecimpunctata TaxID=50387 RepID=UPI003B63BE13